MSSGKPKGKKRERKVSLGTEEQRQKRLALARPKLKSVDRAKIKKIIASAITKYANEKIKPSSKEPMKMNREDIPMDMRVKKGKEIGVKAVRDKFEQLDFNDEDILSLLSIVLQRSQIKSLNLVAPLAQKDKLPTSVYTEMNRYIRQNATMVEELQSENTPLGELIKIVLTEPVDEIKKDVRRLGLSPMPMGKPEVKPADAPEDVPEGKEPKEAEPKGKEPKQGKEPKEAEPKGKEPKQGKEAEVGKEPKDIEKEKEEFIDELANFRREFPYKLNYVKGSLTNEERVKYNNKLNDLKEELKNKNDRLKLGLYTQEGVNYIFVGKEIDQLIESNNKLLTADHDEPKNEKEGIDVEVEVPVMPKGGGMKTIIKNKPKEDVVEIERETRSERQQRQQRPPVTLTEAEKVVLQKIIDRVNRNEDFRKRFKQGAITAQRKMIQLEPDIARAVTPEQLNQISNTYHLRFLLNNYLNRSTLPNKLAEQVVRDITNRTPNQLRIKGSQLPPQSLMPDDSGVDEYLNFFSSTNDPDDLWGKIIGDLSFDASDEPAFVPSDDSGEEPPSITTKGGKKPSIFARPPSFAPSAPSAPSGVATKKIKVPEDWSENKQAKGTLRPKFITPSVNVLQPSEQDIQADFDEWAIFDFVQPVNNYGAEGNNENNPLKRMARVEEETIYRNAGIDLDPSLASVYTNREINTSNEAMAMDMLPPLMPDTSSQPRQVYDVSEYEVKSYDVNNDRTQIEYQSPYDNMTPIVLTNDEIRRSVLYGRVP